MSGECPAGRRGENGASGPFRVRVPDGRQRVAPGRSGRAVHARRGPHRHGDERAHGGAADFLVQDPLVGGRDAARVAQPGAVQRRGVRLRGWRRAARAAGDVW